MLWNDSANHRIIMPFVWNMKYHTTFIMTMYCTGFNKLVIIIIKKKPLSFLRKRSRSCRSFKRLSLWNGQMNCPSFILPNNCFDRTLHNPVTAALTKSTANLTSAQFWAVDSGQLISYIMMLDSVSLFLCQNCQHFSAFRESSK